MSQIPDDDTIVLSSPGDAVITALYTVCVLYGFKLRDSSLTWASFLRESAIHDVYNMKVSHPSAQNDEISIKGLIIGDNILLIAVRNGSSSQIQFPLTHYLSSQISFPISWDLPEAFDPNYEESKFPDLATWKSSIVPSFSKILECVMPLIHFLVPSIQDSRDREAIPSSDNPLIDHSFIPTPQSSGFVGFPRSFIPSNPTMPFPNPDLGLPSPIIPHILPAPNRAPQGGMFVGPNDPLFRNPPIHPPSGPQSHFPPPSSGPPFHPPGARWDPMSPFDPNPPQPGSSTDSSKNPEKPTGQPKIPKKSSFYNPDNDILKPDSWGGFL